MIGKATTLNLESSVRRLNMKDKPLGIRRWKKPLIVGGAFGLVVVSLFAFGMSRTDILAASSEYDKNRADAVKEGLFFARAEVEAMYAIPDSENGAALIAPVLPLLSKLKLNNASTYTEKTVMSHWSELAPAIDTIEEASLRKHLMFKRDFSNPAATLFPEYANVRGWVKLFVKLGEFAVEKNDFESAKRYLNLASYMANSQDDEGMLIGMLVRIACALIVEREVQVLIVSHGRNPRMVSILGEVMTTLDTPYDMGVPLKLENWYSVSMIDTALKDPKSFGDLGYGNSLPNEIKFGRYLPGYGKANISRIMRTYADAAHMMPKDPYDLVGVQRAYGSLDKAGIWRGLSYTMHQILLPALGQSAVAMSKEVAQRNALIQAISLLKLGADPAKGLPLNDRHAMDIDGKPIRLKKTNSGWIFYSIGGDKVDDGGVSFLGQAKGDFVVRLPK